MKRKIEIDIDVLGRGSLKVDGVELGSCVSGFDVKSDPLKGTELSLRILAVDGFQISAEAQVILDDIAREAKTGA